MNDRGEKGVLHGTPFLFRDHLVLFRSAYGRFVIRMTAVELRVREAQSSLNVTD